MAITNNLKERATHDAARISFSEDREVRYWTKTLRVSKKRLEQLIKDHSNFVAAVRSALDQ